MIKDKQYYEIVLDSFGLSFLVAAVRMPSLKEAAEFWKDDIRLISGSDNAKIRYIREVDYEEAISSFDMEGSDEWPVFGAENEQATVGLRKEKLFKRCPRCNYHHFAVTVKIEQKALIGGEGEYLDEYESELKNPVVSDDEEWLCTRCGYKAGGGDFTVRECDLKDKELENVFSAYEDPCDSDTMVYYMGNKCIGDGSKDYDLDDIQRIVSDYGVYLETDSEHQRVLALPLRYTGKCTLRDENGNYVKLTIENLISPNEFPWTDYIERLYSAGLREGRFSADGNFTCKVKCTNPGGVKDTERTLYLNVRNGNIESFN